MTTLEQQASDLQYARQCIRIVQARLGLPSELPTDLQTAQNLGHFLNNRIQVLVLTTGLLGLPLTAPRHTPVYNPRYSEPT